MADYLLSLNRPNGRWRRNIIEDICIEARRIGIRRYEMGEDIWLVTGKHTSEMSEEELEEVLYSILQGEYG